MGLTLTNATFLTSGWLFTTHHDEVTQIPYIYWGWLTLSKKKKRVKKQPLGRDALQDVQERAVPRPSQYATGKPSNTPAQSAGSKVDGAVKGKRTKKKPLGRAAVRDVLERAVPQSTEHATSKPAKKQSQSSGNKLDDATKRAAKRSHSTRTRKRANHLIAAEQLSLNWKWVASSIAILAATITYALWPTLTWAEMAWRIEPDYSHGYLILPLACILLWLRRETFPGLRERCEPVALLLVALSIAMRIAGRFLYMDFLDGYSLVPLIAGLVWFLCGYPALKWSAPAIGFLFLLVPLPYRLETGLSWELQGVATGLSTGFLRVLGLPAISEGHTIWVGENRLMVAEACSGMRIFVGLLALATFWAATVKRCWLDRFILLGAAIPLALLVNAMRITVTGVLYTWFSSENARQIIHDWSGFLMIPLAAALLWCLKTFWENLYRPVEVQTAGESLRRTQDSLPATAEA
ncbi:exosortase/archaeosortase family protein [bacterium]|nr:exosortase/archaeosortase family protein [bacterium]